MTTTIFDTLMYAKKLRKAGVPEKQAEAQAEALKEIIETNLATKLDIRELKAEIKELEYKMTIKMGAMLAMTIGILTAIIKL